MILIDTNVLLDIATDDPKWARWSLRQLDAAAMRGPVLINAIVYAEYSIGYTRIEDVDRVLASTLGLSSERFHAQHCFSLARYFSVTVPKVVAAPGCSPIF